VKTEDLILLGGAAILGYYAFKTLTGKNAFESAGQAVGETTNALIVGGTTGLFNGLVWNPLMQSRQTQQAQMTALNRSNPFVATVYNFFYPVENSIRGFFGIEPATYLM
jgi:hypothetical protein